MKKVIICLTVIVLAIFPFSLSFSFLNTKAYVSPSSLYTYSCYTGNNNSFSFKPSYDGIYLIHALYKSYYSPDTINSPVKLNNSYFSSGTWNGQDVSELDSKYLYNIDVTGFSQSVSYSDKGDYFIYSMITCLPVKAGDNFSVVPSSNSTNVRESSYFFYASYIPGGSGCKMVHVEEGTSHPENPLTYTVESKNQHLAVVFDSDTFLQSDRDFRRSSSLKCSSYPELTPIGYFGNCLDIFSTSYNYTGDISVTLKDSLDNYSFSVYEIFTDGTVTPGYNTEVESATTSPPETTPGTSVGVSVDLSEVLKRLVEIRQSIEDKVIEVTVNTSDAVLERLDSILSSLAELPANMWDSFKVGLSEMFRIEEDTSKPESPPSESESDDETATSSSTTESISLEVDQENFDKVMEEVNVDNLGSNITGAKGSIAFFWYVSDKFLNSMGLYTAVYISLFLAFIAWLIRS